MSKWRAKTVENRGPAVNRSHFTKARFFSALGRLENIGTSVLSTTERLAPGRANFRLLFFIPQPSLMRK